MDGHFKVWLPAVKIIEEFAIFTAEFEAIDHGEAQIIKAHPPYLLMADSREQNLQGLLHHHLKALSVFEVDFHGLGSDLSSDVVY